LLFYFGKPSPPEAYPLYVGVLNKTIEFINEYFPPMSEAEKTSYWTLPLPRFQRFFNFALKQMGKVPNVMSDFYDYHMATKGLLLNSTTQYNRLSQERDMKLINDYLFVVDQKEELVRLYSYSKKKLKDSNIDLEELNGRPMRWRNPFRSALLFFSSGYSMEKVTHKQLQRHVGRK